MHNEDDQRPRDAKLAAAHRRNTETFILTALSLVIGAGLLIVSAFFFQADGNIRVLVAMVGAAIIVSAVARGLVIGLRSEPPPYIAGDVLGSKVVITTGSQGARHSESQYSVDPELRAGDRARTMEGKALERLSQNISALGRRANFSLGAGIIAAVVGVLMLWVPQFINLQPAPQDLVGFAMQYLPRLSIAVIVELVAFFFLRTYARTLTDIRYVQNEFTNIEMKFIALHTSIDEDVADVTKKALIGLINTERNHVLEKGQTSLELERERIEQEGFTAGARIVGEALAGRRAPEEKKEE